MHAHTHTHYFSQSYIKNWFRKQNLRLFSCFRCNICGKEFYEKALFRRHVKKATHGKKGRAKQNLERVCEQCGKKFTQLREYRRHMNNHEGNRACYLVYLMNNKTSPVVMFFPESVLLAIMLLSSIRD